MWVFTYIYTVFILLDQRYDFKPYFSKHLTIVQFWISPIGLTGTNKIDTIGIRTVYGTESRSDVFEIIF